MDAKLKANEWLESSSIDDNAKEDIKSMSEELLTEAFHKSLDFGTGGLRGIMGVGSNRINKYTVGMATQGFANYLKKSNGNGTSVAVAHDSRNNSKTLAKVTADVFSANDIKVYLFEDLRPTPELSFAIRDLGCSGGVVLTASHNPKEYNGYKAYWSDGAQLISPHDQKVMDEVSKIESIDEVNYQTKDDLITIIGQELDDKYLEMVKGLSLDNGAISRQKDLKIVYSPIHGTGITLIPKALQALGFENITVLESQSEPNGDFPTVVYPNPEEQEAMSLALTKAKEIDADLVMATDPDTDRVGIAVKNTKGAFQLLNGNQTGALLVYYLLSKKKEKGFKGNEFIAKTIVTTELIKDIADSYQVNCYDTLTGFKYIAALIGELEGKEAFVGGGEESYGYMIGDKVRDKDAVASCAIIAEMLAWSIDQGKSLFELLIEINKTYGFYHESLKSITKKGIKGAEEIKEMMHQYRSNPPSTLSGSKVSKVIDYQEQIVKNITDGSSEQITLPKSNVLQFLTEDGTKVSVRPSGTEPKIKFYFSVKSDFVGDDYYSELETLKLKVDNLLIDLGL